MAWTSGNETLTDNERDELMSIGASIVLDMEQLVHALSPAIQTAFRHGVVLELRGAGTELARSAEVMLLFTVTDLGGSDEAQVKTFIQNQLRDVFKDPSMARYKAQWAFEVASKK